MNADLQLLSLLGCAVFAFLTVMAFALWSAARQADEIHATLDNYLEKALSCRDKKELNQLCNEVTAFSRAHCRHRSFAAHAIRVLSYLQGKKDATAAVSPATGSAWVSVQDRMPPNEAVIVRVRRKPDAAHAGPNEWEMWACNVRMHTDEVGWWMPNVK